MNNLIEKWGEISNLRLCFFRSLMSSDFLDPIFFYLHGRLFSDKVATPAIAFEYKMKFWIKFFFIVPVELSLGHLERVCGNYLLDFPPSFRHFRLGLCALSQRESIKSIKK